MGSDDSQRWLKLSYLVRCWCESPGSLDAPLIWRFAIQEITADKVLRGFKSLNEVTEFIENQMSKYESNDCSEDK
jgi:hypothetical protein